MSNKTKQTRAVAAVKAAFFRDPHAIDDWRQQAAASFEIATRGRRATMERNTICHEVFVDSTPDSPNDTFQVLSGMITLQGEIISDLLQASGEADKAYMLLHSLLSIIFDPDPE